MDDLTSGWFLLPGPAWRLWVSTGCHRPSAGGPRCRRARGVVAPSEDVARRVDVGCRCFSSRSSGTGLEALARERGVTVAAVVRERIDIVVPLDRQARQSAFPTVLEAAPMDVPERDQLRSELEGIRGRSR